MARHWTYGRHLKPRARAMRADAPPAERKLWYEFLRELPDKFTRQKPLGPYIADFYCARARLIIELDGDSHFTEEARRYDERRSAYLANLGIRVLRFANVEVAESFEAVCANVRAALDGNEKP